MKRLTHFSEGRHYAVNPETGCWNWQRQRDRKGYGLSSGPDRRAHRASWIFAHGAIPSGHVIDHLCRNPSCINPEHLEPVTQAVNTQRGVKAKVTPEQVDEIRARVEAGDSLEGIAREFGVSRHVPYSIATDLSWRADPNAPRSSAVLPERECPNCSVRFNGRRGKKFCTPRCRLLFNGRRRYHRQKAAFSHEIDERHNDA